MNHHVALTTTGLVSVLLPAMAVALRALRERRLRHTMRSLAENPSLSPSRQWVRRLIGHVLQKRWRRMWLASTARRAYLQRLVARNQILRLYGSIELPIDRCYVPLDLRVEQVHHADLLTSPGTYLIFGDPGSGKSALLSQLALTTAQGGSGDGRHSRLPVLATVENLLRYLPGPRGVQVTPAVAFEGLALWMRAEELRPMGLYDSDDLLDTFAGNPARGVIVLLDGLDELHGDDYPLAEQAVVALSLALQSRPGANSLVVAGRQQVLEFMPALVRPDGDFRQVPLSEFSDAAVYSLIARWSFYANGIESTAIASDIFSALRRNSTLFDTCKNPLALSLYLERFYGGGARTARERMLSVETRAAFYTDIVEYLLVTRRSQQRGTPVPTAAIRRERFAFFAQVAADHADSANNYNQIDSEILFSHAATLAGPQGDPEAAVHSIAIETGLLTATRTGWKFVQQSFLDYFVAQTMTGSFVTPRTLDQTFAKLRGNRRMRYEEAFFMACGLVATSSADILTAVLKRLGKDARLSPLYPRACLEAATYTAPGFASAIRGQCRRWREQWAENPIFNQAARLRDLIDVLLEYENFCDELHREKEVTLLEELGPDLAQTAGLSEAVRLDPRVALRLNPGSSIAEMLTAAFPDEAVEALLDTRVLASLSDFELDSSPYLCAVVAECALRSSWVARELAPESFPAFRQRPRRHAVHKGHSPWPATWSIRGTRYSLVLDRALDHLSVDEGRHRDDFPRLELLAAASPPARLTLELITSRWTRNLGLGALALGAFILGSMVIFALGAVLAVVAVGGALLVLRHRILNGHMTTDSMIALNRLSTVGPTLNAGTHKICLRRGDPQPRPQHWRFPGGGVGPTTAAYWRRWGLWQRFSARLGDRQVPLGVCAELMQLPTDEIRRLVAP